MFFVVGAYTGKSLVQECATQAEMPNWAILGFILEPVWEPVGMHFLEDVSAFFVFFAVRAYTRKSVLRERPLSSLWGSWRSFWRAFWEPWGRRFGEDV